MNASFHYNTSNDVFLDLLSQDMNYSSGVWSEDSNESLESAQRGCTKSLKKLGSFHRIMCWTSYVDGATLLLKPLRELAAELLV